MKDEKVFGRLFVVSRQSYGSFVFKYLKLVKAAFIGSKRIVCDYVSMRSYLGIAIIRGSVLPFTDIEWLPCEGFFALLAVLLPLIYTV